VTRIQVLILEGLYPLLYRVEKLILSSYQSAAYYECLSEQQSALHSAGVIWSKKAKYTGMNTNPLSGGPFWWRGHLVIAKSVVELPRLVSLFRFYIVQ